MHYLALDDPAVSRVSLQLGFLGKLSCFAFKAVTFRSDSLVQNLLRSFKRVMPHQVVLSMSVGTKQALLPRLQSAPGGGKATEISIPLFEVR